MCLRMSSQAQSTRGCIAGDLVRSLLVRLAFFFVRTLGDFALASKAVALGPCGLPKAPDHYGWQMISAEF